MTRVLVVLSLAVGAVGASATPVAADCSGPTVEFEPAEVGRGGELTVVGTAFGDNCYDTGPPPDGEGFLGVPQSDIEVRILQGPEEILVAKGDADDDYRFEVTVVVPSALDPGAARLVVRLANGGEAFLVDNGPFVITDAEPVAGADETVVAFGQDDDAEEEPAESGAETAEPEEDDDGPPLELLGILLFLFALGACVAYPMLARRRAAGG